MAIDQTNPMINKSVVLAFYATLAEKGQFKVVGGNKMATLAINSKIRILNLGL